MDELVQELLDMPQKEFHKVVDRDIRGVQTAALRADPLVVERWYQTLASMKRSVEGTLAAKNAEAKADRIACLKLGDHEAALSVSEEHQRWRAGAIRFATGVSEMLSEARFHRFRLYPAIEWAAESQRNQITERYQILVAAVREHRHEILSDEDADPSEADETLWSHLPD